jgi:4-methylaminobutanoate oxidase (formaldehyde-forming)
MPAFRASRVKESLESVYQAHYPHKPTKTCRNVKRSPLHARLEEQGAAWRDVSGWECADWFAGSIKEDDEDNTRRLHAPLSWGRHHWFETWQNEHLACRQSAGVIDMSFMSKFKVQVLLPQMRRAEGTELGRLF